MKIFNKKQRIIIQKTTEYGWKMKTSGNVEVTAATDALLGALCSVIKKLVSHGVFTPELMRKMVIMAVDEALAEVRVRNNEE